MAVRYIAGNECWHPFKAHAAIVIDDPLLRDNYGFLNFQTPTQLGEQAQFPRRDRIYSSQFSEELPPNHRVVLGECRATVPCFHGNDHTESEFASRDPTVLSTLLQNAEHRMNVHEQITGLQCDKVMVFPQGNFSLEAMKVLRSRNFNAAVNTVPYPLGEEDRLTIRILLSLRCCDMMGSLYSSANPAEKSRSRI